MEPLISLTPSQLLAAVLAAVVIGLLVGFSYIRTPVVVQHDQPISNGLPALLGLGIVVGVIVVMLALRILS